MFYFILHQINVTHKEIETLIFNLPLFKLNVFLQYYIISIMKNVQKNVTVQYSIKTVCSMFELQTVHCYYGKKCVPYYLKESSFLIIKI